VLHGLPTSRQTRCSLFSHSGGPSWGPQDAVAPPPRGAQRPSGQLHQEFPCAARFQALTDRPGAPKRAAMNFKACQCQRQEPFGASPARSRPPGGFPKGDWLATGVGRFTYDDGPPQPKLAPHQSARSPHRPARVDCQPGARRRAGLVGGFAFPPPRPPARPLQPRKEGTVNNPPDEGTLWWQIRHGVPPQAQPGSHLQTEAERERELAQPRRAERAEANWPVRKENTHGNGP
jgi:hypothetical protein